MLAIEPPRIGTTYLWLIEDLMSRPSGDVTDWVRGDTWEERWHKKLNSKRKDDHYPDVLTSLETHGYIRPLDATTHFRYEESREYEGSVRLADGHHRFAAAIDLGHEAVPILLSETSTVSPDSGNWRAGKPVSRRAGISYRKGDVPSDYSGALDSSY